MDGSLIFVYLFQYELWMVGLYLFIYFNMNYDGRLIFVYLFQYELWMVGLYSYIYFNMNYGW